MRIVVYSEPATEPVTVAETIAACRIDTINQEPAPAAPTVALGSGAGNVDNGAHRYRVTFVTADGETQGGDISDAVTVADKSINGKVQLTAIPLGGSMVTSRKIYRTAAGGSIYYLLATIANNTATTYTDNIADASLGAAVPSENTTGDAQISRHIKSARQEAEKRLRRYLVTQTLDAYFDAFPDADKNNLRMIKLPPLQSVSAITYIDTDGAEQTLDAARYQVDATGNAGRILPAYGYDWPSTRDQMNAVKVRFIAGYGAASAVPEPIKDWIKMRAKQKYDQPDAAIVGANISEMPRQFVHGLLDPFIASAYP